MIFFSNVRITEPKSTWILSLVILPNRRLPSYFFILEIETSNRGKTQALRKRIQNHGLEKILKKKKGTLRHYYFSKWGERFYSEILCIHKLFFPTNFSSLKRDFNQWFKCFWYFLLCFQICIWFQNKILKVLKLFFLLKVRQIRNDFFKPKTFF